MTPDVETAVKNAKAGQVRFRTDKNGIVHGAIGKVTFDLPAIKENLEALLSDLKARQTVGFEGYLSEEDYSVHDHGSWIGYRPGYFRRLKNSQVPVYIAGAFVAVTGSYRRQALESLDRLFLGPKPKAVKDRRYR